MTSVGVDEVRQFEHWCSQFFETTDPVARNEAEKRLIGLSDDPNGLHTCQQIIEHAQSPYALTIAVNAMTRAIQNTNVLATLTIDQRAAIRSFLLRKVFTHAQRGAHVINAFAKAYSVLTRIGWFDRIGSIFVHRRVIEDFVVLFEGASEETNSVNLKVVLTLLTHVVVEMSTLREKDMCFALSVADYRYVNASFRDVALLSVFKFATSTLRDATSNVDQPHFVVDMEQGAVLDNCLRLLHACLAYDFVGSLSEDPTNEEMQIVHLPASWQSQVVDGSLVNIAFRLFESSPQFSMALSVLLHLSAVRRSLFTIEERHRYLVNLLNGAVRLLESQQLFADEINHHTFSRLLARLAFNYPLTELASCDIYTRFVRLVCCFTVNSLNARNCSSDLDAVSVSSNSLFYVLAFWRRVVAGIAYLEDGESPVLAESFREVAAAYVTSRIDVLTARVKQCRTDASDGDDPLEDETTLRQQLDQLAWIARFDYDQIASLVIHLLDQQVARFQMVTRPQESGGENAEDPLAAWTTINRSDITVTFYHSSWLIYVAGAIISARVSFSCTNDHDECDAAILCRVLKLSTMCDSLVQQNAEFESASLISASLHETFWKLAKKLELAWLFFLERLRKTNLGAYVVMPAMYSYLADNAGIRDETVLLSVIFDKLMTNLRCWNSNRSERVLEQSVEALYELTLIPHVAHRLCKLDNVQLVLNNHSLTHLAIFRISDVTMPVTSVRRSVCKSCRQRGSRSEKTENENAFRSIALQLNSLSLGGLDETDASSTCTCKVQVRPLVSRLRRVFYAALGRLLMVNMDEENEEQVFDRFMSPFQLSLANIQNTLRTAQVSHDSESNCAALISALALDLRGLLSTFIGSSLYVRFFAAIHPQLSDILVRAIDSWFSSQPQLVISALRFFAELGYNRSQRIEFGPLSPNGYLLFRDLCRVVCLVGTKLEKLDSVSLTRTASYLLKPKAIAICFSMLRSALVGGFANFGVMRFYGDHSFDQAVQAVFRMILITSSRDLKDYPKLRTAYYELIECISENFVHCLTRLDQNLLAYVLETIASGIASVDSATHTTCCNILDRLLIYIYSNQRTRQQEQQQQQQQQREQQRQQTDARDSLLALAEKQVDVFERCLFRLLERIMEGGEQSASECSTRPLLSLMVLFERSFPLLKEQMVRNAPEAKRERLDQLFITLMRDIDSSINTENRERFVQNVLLCTQLLSEPDNSSSNTVAAPFKDSYNASTDSSSCMF